MIRSDQENTKRTSSEWMPSSIHHELFSFLCQRLCDFLALLCDPERVSNSFTRHGKSLDYITTVLAGIDEREKVSAKMRVPEAVDRSFIFRLTSNVGIHSDNVGDRGPAKAEWRRRDLAVCCTHERVHRIHP